MRTGSLVSGATEDASVRRLGLRFAFAAAFSSRNLRGGGDRVHVRGYLLDDRINVMRVMDVHIGTEHIPITIDAGKMDRLLDDRDAALTEEPVHVVELLVGKIDVAERALDLFLGQVSLRFAHLHEGLNGG